MFNSKTKELWKLFRYTGFKYNRNTSKNYNGHFTVSHTLLLYTDERKIWSLSFLVSDTTVVRSFVGPLLSFLLVSCPNITT